MTPEELNMLIELKNCLSETLLKVKEVYKDSAYYQCVDYAATNNDFENWLWRARKSIARVKEYESKNL